MRIDDSLRQSTSLSLHLNCLENLGTTSKSGVALLNRWLQKNVLHPSACVYIMADNLPVVVSGKSIREILVQKTLQANSRPGLYLILSRLKTTM